MWLKRYAIALAAVAVMGQSAAQDQAPRPMNPYEREAIEIVNHLDGENRLVRRVYVKNR